MSKSIFITLVFIGIISEGGMAQLKIPSEYSIGGKIGFTSYDYTIDQKLIYNLSFSLSPEYYFNRNLGIGLDAFLNWFNEEGIPKDQTSIAFNMYGKGYIWHQWYFTLGIGYDDRYEGIFNFWNMSTGYSLLVKNQWSIEPSIVWVNFINSNVKIQTLRYQIGMRYFFKKRI